MGRQYAAPGVLERVDELVDELVDEWADAVVLVGRLRRGESLDQIALGGLPTGERATLEACVTYAQSCTGAAAAEWGAESPTPVVVTDRRILVGHPHRGLVSLWHVDLENLQLARTDRGWHLDLHPVGINPHVRLSGGAAPVVALHVAHTVFPNTWSRLSGLLPLLDSAA